MHSKSGRIVGLVILTFASLGCALLARVALSNGNAAFEAGDLSRAIGEYTNAINADPKLTEAYYNRGLVYHQSGRPEMAVLDFTKAIESDPKFTNAYFARASEYDGLGALDFALADYAKLIEMDPKMVMAYDGHGWVNFEKGNFDLALDDLNIAIALDANYANAYDNRGLVHTQKGEYAAALRDLNQAIKLAESSPAERRAEYYKDRAALYLRQKQYDQALADVSQALDLDPQHANAYLTRGYIMRELGRRDEARFDLETFMRLAPNSRNLNQVRQVIIELQTLPAPSATLAPEAAASPTGTTIAGLNPRCQTMPANFAGKKSPYALDDGAALAAGKELYGILCAACHGVAGKGDGPAAPSLNPKPGNETDLAFMQSIPISCQFYIISEGIAGTAMPRWRSLDEDAIWKVLIYERSLSRAK